MDEDAARRARAAARRQRMTILRTTHDSNEDACPPIRGEAAVSLATRLSRMAWALSGRPFPTYTRAEIPVRFVERK